MFLFPINSLIYPGMCLIPNYGNKQFHFWYKIKQPNVCLCLHINQGLLHKPHALFFQADYLLKKLH